ncbi:alpha/beta hydrolase [Corynebacterium pseudopelargi]|uniref:DUF1023 domain-containing protein n=1 Tax=Corynebacterium pseudopelargi TaxID=2080757 RepID=A0A3G6IS04_9CORY|nr:alpha/beta hydrolase [Corynebacterium pseudopelargi]AZA08385.1 hypothetical protein CPPEL_01190 [Corynebacterium pseudopelargi]
MSTPLQASELAAAAATHHHNRASMLEVAQAHTQQWKQGFQFSSGEAFEAGQRMLLGQLAQWQHTGGIYEDIAQILQLTSTAQRELEQILNTITGLPQQVFNAIPGVATLYLGLHFMGQELDRACATQLNALCAQPAADVELPEDPEATILQIGHGTAVVAYGDLEHASSIVTLVPGVGSSDPEHWPAKLEEAKTVAASTGGAAIAWMGYIAPPHVLGGIATEPAVVGAEDLQRFQASLREQNPHAKLVVMGHSYGSVLTGHAARKGLDADTIIYAGSPGVPGYPHHRHTKVIAVMNHGDPIGLSGTNQGAIHGMDPAALSYRSEKWNLPRLGHSYAAHPEFLEKLNEEVASARPQAPD